MLKQFKQATLKSVKSAGISTLVQNSRWRRQRLLILAYHGISALDEHEWNYTQYMPPGVLRSRFQQLKVSRCAVLPLDEALARLQVNDLPDRAVAITFDDGFADFHSQALPLIKEFDLPVTLYLTTFYSQFNRPVFDLMLAYLLWKGRHQVLDLHSLIRQPPKLSLRTDEAQDEARVAILDFAKKQKLSAAEKDHLITKLARELGIDYESLVEKRIIQNLTVAEVGEVAANGIDVQLHTHRHRTPKDHALFMREIEDNRASIESITGRRANHFCYPSGAYDPMFLPWLKEAGVVSATTCEPGFASLDSHQLLLPRIVDTPALSPIEFESWLTGVSAALPRRRVARG
jgi:peptidoglycan/xylan/chitin deacetylase (PgdA/CDA1 family)